jgi:hypothetical protein
VDKRRHARERDRERERERKRERACERSTKCEAFREQWRRCTTSICATALRDGHMCVAYESESIVREEFGKGRHGRGVYIYM